jgi:3-deoxy-D-arabino-heptulosonate 7-phosphate (DAHP) synthase class II
MHVDLNLSSRLCHRLKERLPKVITSLWDAAFAVNPQCESFNGGTVLQEKSQGIPRVRRVIRRIQSFDVVIGMRTVCPLIGMRPETYLALQTVCLRFFGYELKCLKVPFPFGVG